MKDGRATRGKSVFLVAGLYGFDLGAQLLDLEISTSRRDSNHFIPRHSC